MAPWEENVYLFDPITTATTTAGANGTVSITKNAQRLSLTAFFGSNANNAILTRGTDTLGINLSPTYPEKKFNAHDDPKLTQDAWTITAPAPGTVIGFWEVVARTWPPEPDIDATRAYEGDDAQGQDQV